MGDQQGNDGLAVTDRNAGRVPDTRPGRCAVAWGLTGATAGLWSFAGLAVVTSSASIGLVAAAVVASGACLAAGMLVLAVARRARLRPNGHGGIRVPDEPQPDRLTGLPNGAALAGMLAQALREAKPTQIALMAIDLDGFSALNDTLGLVIGDEILRQVATSLRRCLRPWDLVARIGGDEFAIMVGGPHAEASVGRVHDRLRRALGAVVIGDGREVRLGLSAGYAINDTGTETARDLLRNADLALARARTAHRVDVVRYEAPMREALLSRVQAEQELRAALAGHQLEMVYQPIVSLGDGRVVGAEALVRWRHPERGLVTASEFVPLAEQMRIVHELGAWSLRQACRDLRTLKEAIPSLGVFDVSVNVSGHQVEHELVQEVAHAAADAGIAPSEVTLEVTESVLASRPEDATEVLSQLRALGCRIALDDFGTGYSSLSYLARFPVDIIKIDRSFVCELDTDPQQLALTRTIVALGQSLHLSTIAEGVESTGQAVLLRSLGCGLAQGFMLGRPAPLADLIQTLWSARDVVSLGTPHGISQARHRRRRTETTFPSIRASSPGTGS